MRVEPVTNSGPVIISTTSPGSGIVLEDEQTGAMMYLRYGKGN
jgi:hypothetical protein